MKGHIKQRSKGSWSIVIELDKGPDGKRKQQWSTVQGTKRDAEKELTKLLHSRNTGEYLPPSKQTVGEYLAHWLEAYARTNVAGKTFDRYQDIIRGHLAPALGSIPLRKLTPMHIQGYYSQALQTGRLDGRGGLSPQTVLHYHRVLHEALGQAVRWQQLLRNPAEAVEPPRAPRKEMQVFDEAEVAKLLETAQGTRHYLPILLAITTGMRRGEVLALRWKDADLAAGCLSVCQSLQQTRAGLAFKAPKTNKGRKIALVLQR